MLFYFLVINLYILNFDHVEKISTTIYPRVSLLQIS